jgi:hypothetical protein
MQTSLNIHINNNNKIITDMAAPRVGFHTVKRRLTSCNLKVTEQEMPCHLIIT